MDNPPEPAMSYDEIKIVINTCDSKVNGSVAALTAIVFGAFGILRLYDKPHSILELLTEGQGTNLWDGRWWGLTAAYFVLGLMGVLFSYRAIAYSELSAIAGQRLKRTEKKVHHNSTVEIFNSLVDEMSRPRNFSSWMMHKAIRQKNWLKFFVIALYLLPLFAVAFKF